MTYDAEVAADSPMAWWKLDETSGTTVVDYSGNGYDGTTGGTVTRSRPGLCGDVTHRATQLHVNAYVDLPAWTDNALNMPNYSLEAWVHRVSEESTFPGILAMGTHTGFSTEYAADANGFYFYLAENFDIFHFKRKGVFGPGTDPGSLEDFPDCFNHVVCTYDGTYHQMYLNGVPSGTPYGPRVWGTSDVPAITETTPFRIGDIGTPSRPGNIDYAHVAMYDHTLSPADISRHFLAGACGECFGFGGWVEGVKLTDGALHDGWYITS